jgi:S-adenosylmethionine decarboxylase
MKHILFTLKGCDPDLLNDNHHIRSGLVAAARETGSKVLDWSTHCFQPQGVTSIVLLADSHISVHTWPEKGVAVCDIFTCGSHTNPEKGVEYLQKWFKSTEIDSQEIIRSL